MSFYVYELRNDADEIIYIGATEHPDTRVRHHRRHQPWGSEIASSRISGVFGTRYGALAYEAQRIARMQPRHNRKHASHPDAVASRSGGRPKGHRLSVAAWDDLLLLKGESLTSVAAKAGVQRATLSGMVIGRSRASVPTAHKLANALACNPATLFPTLRPFFNEAEVAS